MSNRPVRVSLNLLQPDGYISDIVVNENNIRGICRLVDGSVVVTYITHGNQLFSQLVSNSYESLVNKLCV